MIPEIEIRRDLCCECWHLDEGRMCHQAAVGDLAGKGVGFQMLGDKKSLELGRYLLGK